MANVKIESIEQARKELIELIERNPQYNIEQKQTLIMYLLTSTIPVELPNHIFIFKMVFETTYDPMTIVYGYVSNKFQTVVDLNTLFRLLDDDEHLIGYLLEKGIF